MTRPGVEVQTLATAVAQGAPTDTGTAFMVGVVPEGRTDKAILVRRFDELIGLIGERQPWSTYLHDAAEVFFAEGGSTLYLGRVVGPAATAASVTVPDQDAGANDTLTFTAAGEGSYGADLSVTIENTGSTFSATVTRSGGGSPLETFSGLETPQDAVDAMADSGWVQATNENSASATPNPADGTYPLVGGDDDRVNVTADHYTAALNLFVDDFGPGQVLAPGQTNTSIRTAIINHVNSTYRTALLDLVDNSDATAIIADAGNVASDRALAYTPWVQVTGIVPDRVRRVPPSAFAAGAMARNDASQDTNNAVAGLNGMAQYVLGVVRQFSESQREALNEAGVNVIREIRGSVQIYGARSLSPNNVWRWAPNVRFRMELEARARAVAESFVFQRLDGQGRTITQFAALLSGMMADYQADGAIYGTDDDPGYVVDVGSGVNTPQTVADGQLKAQVRLRFSPTAEWVLIDLVKIPVSSTV